MRLVSSLAWSHYFAANPAVRVWLSVLGPLMGASLSFPSPQGSTTHDLPCFPELTDQALP